MPTISNLAQALPQSPIRKLVPLAEDAKKRGVKVYHLNIGQPDIKSPEFCFDVLKQFKDTYVEYSHSAGYESLRQKVVSYYKSIDVAINLNNVIITTGGSEALLFSFMATCNPGDEIIVTEPFYTNYNSFAQLSGVVFKAITTNIDNGFALPEIHEFEKLINSKTKGILICNPNNPTGYLYSKEELIVLKEIVKKHNLYLFVDEVYREFCYDGNTYFSSLNLTEIENNVVVIDSVSKRYSLCGVRIGMVISRNEAFMAAMLKMAQARLSPPSLGQMVSEKAFDAPQSYFNAVVDEYSLRRNFVINKLSQIKGVKYNTPKGAFYLIIELPVDSAENFCKWLLTDFNYQNETVMLAPANGFYSTPNAGVRQVRLAYVLNINELEKAMLCLEQALMVYPNKF